MPESPIQDIVCCVGQPVAGNPTQFMMQRAFAAAGLDWYCLTLEVSSADLDNAIRGIRAFGFRGANLTIPHKVAVVPLLDAIGESARLMGAVNCIQRVGDQLVGENTDGQGFVQALRDISELAEKKVLLLGAGGTARAIAVELGRSGVAEIHIANRTMEKGESLAELLQGVATTTHIVPWSPPLSVAEDVDILINATAIGLLDPDAQVPVKIETLKPSMIVADVVINPPHTWLLRMAQRQGCTTLNGLGMLVNQAAASFALWTGLEADRAVMREAVEEFLEI